MSITLTPQELIDLTGYKRKSKQAEWLKKNGFKFRPNRAGHPKVDREHYLTKMGRSGAQSTGGPNWGSIGGES